MRRLGDGPVADSWLLERGDQPFVLRRDRPCALRLGLDRDREFRAMQAAHRDGLAPEPRFLATDPGVLVSRFVPGDPWQAKAQIGDHHLWSRLGALLRRVHALSPEAVPRFELADTLAGYARAAGTPDARALARELTARSERLYRDDPLVLCHHDPHLGNVIGEPGVFIDWEYAARGHPLFDLAFVIEYHALDATAQSALVAGWGGEDPPVFLRHLGDFRALVAGVNQLWSLAIDACG